MQALSKDLECWLRSFAESVRRRDFESSKALFDPEVLAFGTVCSRAEGLHDLAARQWAAVWPHTRDFDFAYSSSRASIDAHQAVIIAVWSSIGIARNGTASWPREGRATIVLQMTPAGWKAIHTHFSLTPAERP